MIIDNGESPIINYQFSIIHYQFSIIKFLFTLLLQISLLTLSGQKFAFTTLDVTKGLPSDYVTVLYEDSKGNMWIGSDKGVCRYDGKEFMTINTDNGLTSNMVYAIGEDSNGMMYFGMFEGGACKWDGKKVEKVPIACNTIKSIKGDDWGRAYMMGCETLYIMDGDRITKHPFDESFLFATIYKAKDNQFYISGIHNNLKVMASKEGVTTQMLSNHDTKNAEEFSKAITETEFWNRGRPSPFGSSPFFMPRGRFSTDIKWYEGKYFTFNRAQHLVSILQDKEIVYGVENGFPECNTIDILADGHGCLWVATFGQGIRIWQGSYLTWYDQPNGKTNSIAFNDHEVFLTTNEGAWTISSDKKRVQKIDNGNLTVYFENALGAFRGTMEGGIQKKNKLGKWENLYFEASGVSSFFLKNDTLFSGFYGKGVVMVPIHNKNEKCLDKQHGLADLMIERVIPFKHGFAATSYSKGISFINGNHELRVIDQSKGLLSNTVYCAFEMPDGKFWVGTEHGINLLNNDKTVIQNFDAKNGIVGSKIINVFTDRQGRLWALSDKYLHLWENGSYWQAIKSHPLMPTDELFINRSAYNPFDNNLYLGLNKGLSVIDMGKMAVLKMPPPKVAPILYINEQLVDITNDAQCGFPLKELEISFPVKSYLPSLSPKLWLKLEGYDADWNSAEKYAATYKRVPPGEYRLLAIWEGPDGATSGEYEVFKLHIAYPFWLHGWFIALSLLLAIGLTYLVVRYFVNLNLRRRMRMFELRQRIQAERERISRDLHDNVGAQITQAIRHLDILALQSDKLSESQVSNKLEQTTLRLRNTMQLLRDTIWALREESVTFGRLGNRLRTYLAAYLGELEIGPAWSLKTEGDAERPIPPTLALSIFRIIQEAAQNTLKHADASHFDVDLFIAGDHLCLRIKDDGKGLPDNYVENALGDGIENMRTRAEEANGTFDMGAPEGGKGCQIEVNIPLTIPQ